MNGALRGVAAQLHAQGSYMVPKTTSTPAVLVTMAQSATTVAMIAFTSSSVYPLPPPTTKGAPKTDTFFTALQQLNNWGHV